MSLHAELSPEAQARLDAQKRNSTISSIIISALTVVLLGLILAFILIKPLFQETPTIVTYQGNSSKDEEMETRKMTNQIQRKPSAPSSSLAKVIAANTTSPTAVPIPEVDVPDPSTDFGSGDDFGDGWGSGGDGGGGGFGNIPATMRKRCSKEDRIQRLQESGGTEKCEEAVVKALDWLQKTQNKDGSWDGTNKSAMTGIAILAYLGHCETPLSEKYGDTVLRGLTFLINMGMANNGKLIEKGGEKNNSWVYEHGISTYALGEATTFCKQLGVNVPNLQEVTQRAGQYIIDNQHKSGGWDYKYSEDSGRGGDLSVVAWQVQALKACKHTGLDFRNMRSCMNKALDYVRARSASNGAYCYTGNAGKKPYETLTGAGMLCMQMWDKGSDSTVRSAAKYLRKNSKFKWADPSEASDLYAHYYESQAMMNRGGEDWKFYNKNFRDELLAAQNEDGSFKATGWTKHGVNKTHYRTCLATLMLEVYYRFLPGTGAGVSR
jgi:hypothetical protein